MTIPDELRLVLACCRRSYPGRRNDKILLAEEAIDWPRFVRLIKRHRVQGLVAHALAERDICVPDMAADPILADAVVVAEQNLRAASESLRMFSRFRDAGVEVLFVKGLTLSSLAYHDPFRKMSADVDILVDPLRLANATKLLLELGYELIDPDFEVQSEAFSQWHRRNKESVWTNAKFNIVVELHTRLTDNEALIPNIGILSDRQNVSIGASGSLPTLTSDDLFAYLSVHGASSAWFRLKWIVDFAALYHCCEAIEIEQLYRRAKDQNAGRAPALALLLADYLDLLQLPSDFRTALNSSAAHRLLLKIALKQLLHETEPTKRSLGTFTIHLSQLLLLKNPAFKVSEVLRQWRALKLLGRHT